MVTKLDKLAICNIFSIILAKIHMVTKRGVIIYGTPLSIILAKIHMVTKLKKV